MNSSIQFSKLCSYSLIDDEPNLSSNKNSPSQMVKVTDSDIIYINGMIPLNCLKQIKIHLHSIISLFKKCNIY